MFFSFVKGQYNCHTFGSIVRNAMIATNSTLIIRYGAHVFLIEPDNWEYPKVYTCREGYTVSEPDCEGMTDLLVNGSFTIPKASQIGYDVFNRMRVLNSDIPKGKFPIGEVQFSLTDNVEDLFWVNVE